MSNGYHKAKMADEDRQWKQYYERRGKHIYAEGKEFALKEFSATRYYAPHAIGVVTIVGAVMVGAVMYNSMNKKALDAVYNSTY